MLTACQRQRDDVSFTMSMHDVKVTMLAWVRRHYDVSVTSSTLRRQRYNVNVTASI